MITRVCQTLRDTGTLPGVRIAAERDVNESVGEEKALFRWYRAVHVRVGEELQDVFVFPTRVWRTLQAEGMCPYYAKRVQHLGSGDFAERLEFCKWPNGSPQLHHYISFTNDVQFNRDDVNNTYNSHVLADENPYATVESNFQLYFSVNVWCAVLDDQQIGPFILEGRVTGEACLRFMQEELPRLLEDVPLNKRGRMYFQHDGAPPHSSREVRNFLNYRFLRRWIGCGGPHNWTARSPELSSLDYCVWGWMK